jgi:hypothetical protein
MHTSDKVGKNTKPKGRAKKNIEDISIIKNFLVVITPEDRIHKPDETHFVLHIHICR